MRTRVPRPHVARGSTTPLGCLRPPRKQHGRDAGTPQHRAPAGHNTHPHKTRCWVPQTAAADIVSHLPEQLRTQMLSPRKRAPGPGTRKRGSHRTRANHSCSPAGCPHATVCRAHLHDFPGNTGGGGGGRGRPAAPPPRRPPPPREPETRRPWLGIRALAGEFSAAAAGEFYTNSKHVQEAGL
jgi:hypothetical protein